MASLAEKIRFGLIELRGPDSSVYVSPSFFQRIYLLWTFRHFRSLPKQVLNHRQQQLVEKLCCSANLTQARPFGHSLIGAVENVRLSAELAAIRSKATHSSHAEFVLPQATRPEKALSRSTRLALRRDDEERASRPTANPEYALISQTRPAERRKPPSLSTSETGSGPTRKRFPWALAAAVGTVLIALLIHFRDGQPDSIQTISQVAFEAQGPALPDVPNVPRTHFEQPHELLPAEAASRAVTAALKSAPPIIPSIPLIQNEGQPRQEWESGAPANFDESVPAAADPSPQKRMQVVEAPTVFGYPVPALPARSGTVNLKIVIGTDGAVSDVRVLSGEQGLASAAIQAVRHWRYRPHTFQGNPVEAETSVAIRFAGDDAVSVGFLANH